MALRILAIETSTRSSSIALADSGRIAGEHMLHPTETTAAALVPAIRELLQEADWTPGSIDVVACSTGPGSFTGLRIGLATAKTWAHVAGKRLVGVATSDIVAHQAWKWISHQAPQPRCDASRRIAVLIHATRGRFFLACYEATERDELVPSAAPSLSDGLGALDRLPAGTWLAGSALARRSEGERKELATRHVLLPEAVWSPRATTLAAIAAQRAAEGRFDSPLELAPHYLRPSYAEENTGTKRSSC